MLRALICFVFISFFYRLYKLFVPKYYMHEKLDFLNKLVIWLLSWQ